MKQLLRGIVGFMALLPALSAHAADTYILDPMHTYVLWHINHFGFSNPSGKWMASGTLQLDQKNHKNDKVNVTIAMNNLVTGIPELDKHLSTPLFFDMAHFPTATFVSDKVTPTSKTTLIVHGLLTVHGVSKPVSLQVKLNKLGLNPINNKESVGYSATAQLKRSNFGINALLPGLSDDVKLDIEVEASKAS